MLVYCYLRKRFEVPKGGDERTGFLRALSVFGWISLACGYPSHILMYSGCVSVLLHAFSWLCLVPRCYMVLPGCYYMKAELV